MKRTPTRLSAAAIVLALGACERGAPSSPDTSTATEAEPKTSEVLVLGMIHDGHRESATYGVDVIKAIVRAVDPDYVLAEIPPDRLDAALASYRATGAVDEDRVERFPEYTDAIIPLTTEMGFEIIPCAAWAREMADARRAKLAELEASRPDVSAAVELAQTNADATITDEGLDATPLGSHTPRYDALVKEGLEPYDRLFNDELGPGGWTNINAAHYALIANALDAHRGEGRRFLITFGSWHKYWLLEQLRERDDVTLLSLEDFVGE